MLFHPRGFVVIEGVIIKGGGDYVYIYICVLMIIHYITLHCIALYVCVYICIYMYVYK